jgi:4-amino-4-deoxy-L-arabinose transferase-like glycosyltransferase
LSGTARTRDRALVAVVFAVSFSLRVAAIDRPLSVDEGFWVERGALFVSALLRHEPAATYVRPHPGVTTMWLVGTSNAAWCYAEAASEQPGSWQTCLGRLAVRGHHPLIAYVVPRLVLAIVTSAAVAALFALSARLLGVRVALPAAALLAFEPFFLAHQRFITTDALAADLAGIAVLLFLLHLREGGRRWLLASAVAFGLAAATKMPVVLMLPPMAAWILAVERGIWPAFAPKGTRQRAIELGAWALVAAASVIVIWPALWVRPLLTAQSLLADLRSEKEAYSIRLDDPTWSFYARALVWRLSPLLQAGAALTAVALMWPAWRRRLDRRAEWEALALLAIATLVLLRLSGGAAVERYLLPVVPVMALLAGGGWAWLGERLEGLLPRRRTGSLLLGGVALGQLALLVPHLSGAMTFYNPLLGGAPAARQVLAIGMGEGLDRAAEWLNRQPGSESMVVASGCSSAFAPYFRGRTIEQTYAEDPTMPIEADRLVIYVRQVQMESVHPILMSYLESQRPLHVVTMHGLDYAWIYGGPIVLPEPWRELAVGDAGAAPP